jgi:nitrate/TMAO reductase-like tetraheme cytochrome c subunit
MPETQGTGKRVIVATAKSAAEVTAGSWYHGFACKGCDTQFAVFEDRSGGQNPAKMSGDGHIRVTCPHCGVEHVYGTSEIRNFQL